MKTALFFLLTAVAILSYFPLAFFFGIRQDVPAAHLLAGLVGCALLVRRLAEPGSLKARTARAVALAFGLFLVVGFAWYTLDYSAYDRKGPASVQDRAVAELSSMELVRHDGTPASLLGADGSKATLLVLYRGYW